MSPPLKTDQRIAAAKVAAEPRSERESALSFMSGRTKPKEIGGSPRGEVTFDCADQAGSGAVVSAIRHRPPPGVRARRPIVRDRLPFARLQKMMTNLVVEAKRCPIWFTHLKPTPFAFDIVGLVE
jgi:hypothetical protein